ncbi:MAG: hypothetical protein B6I31_04955 [Desulfobacteraceae bacterium 4572_19]|nr:MAG: hypothetical protein B6I31_04955 [Desulfobacteraceae bacterium 4572_19]
MLTKQRITRIIESWYLKEPLFFAVWTTHELCINPNMQNIRVGDGKIEYNPSFIKALDEKTLSLVLQFEVMRIILKHPYLRRKDVQRISYAASNITVQEYLRTPLDFPYAKDVFQSDKYDTKYFEFYYHQLLEQEKENSLESNDLEQNNELQNNNTQTGKGEENKSEPDLNEDSNEKSNKNDISDESKEETSESSETSESPETSESSETSSSEESDCKENDKGINQYINYNICGAENTEFWDINEYHSNLINDKIELILANNSWGTIPDHIQEQIIATLKPKINYREILKSFRASILSSNRVLTRMKPSRRYGFLYMGSRRDFCTKLLFAVDVSGSVSNEDVRNAFSIINQLFKYGIESVEVLQFDTEVKGDLLSLKKAKYKVQVKGRGGTDFQPVLDYIDQNRGYDGLIIFTDGWASIPFAPKNRKTKILWLFNNEYNYTKIKDQLKSIGYSTFIKEN